MVVQFNRASGSLRAKYTDEADLVNWIPVTCENWEIIEDSTGLAARVMAGEIDGTTEQDYQENWKAMDEMVEVLKALEKVLAFCIERDDNINQT